MYSTAEGTSVLFGLQGAAIGMQIADAEMKE